MFLLNLSSFMALNFIMGYCGSLQSSGSKVFQSISDKKTAIRFTRKWAL